MPLSTVRDLFLRHSGRYDLGTIGGADNGANTFINEGQKYLDRLMNNPKSQGRVFRKLSTSGYHVLFPYCRVIESVWVGDSDSLTKLEKVEMSDLKEAYNQPFSQLDTGKPLYYSPAVLRMVPESDRTAIEDVDGMLGYMDVMFGKHYEYNGVIMLPPADKDYHVEVWGLFLSPPLTSDSDESYWTENHPLVLMMAAMRQVEIVYRNTEGRKDWEAAIQAELYGVERDFVDEGAVDSNEMEG